MKIEKHKHKRRKRRSLDEEENAVFCELESVCYRVQFKECQNRRKIVIKHRIFEHEFTFSLS